MICIISKTSCGRSSGNDVRGFLQRFDPGIGLFLFNQLCCIFQKCIRFCAADEESWHFEILQVAPDIEVLRDWCNKSALPIPGNRPVRSRRRLFCRVIPSI